jgi:glycerol-3-phosphate dehydrogenase subunit C
MREGSLDAPVRHPIPWRDKEFYDREALDKEARRVFDICHGCRRCFNLCDSFPRLFDLIDESESGELDTVASADFKPVVDACTLCDMCFMTKCPYVPPHEFDLDFPHLMLRYRAVEYREGKVPFVDRQLTETDRNGKALAPVAKAVNWACQCENQVTRPLMEKVTKVHRDAELPAYTSIPLTKRKELAALPVNQDAPAVGRKAVIYATCFANYNNPAIGEAAMAVLAQNGVETKIIYPSCCGMPQLEHGDIGRVAEQARKVAAELRTWVDQGYDVISLVSSCSLMMKFEWPLIEPDDENIKRLSQATYELSEYVVDIARKEGLAEGLKPLAGDVSIHIACHARAQNMGQKGAEMLKLLPDTSIKVIERCSGHGGSWGVMRDNFETALKIGKPVAKQAAEHKSAFVVSECPLARDHILQGMERLDAKTDAVEPLQNPIQLIARSYGLC